MPLDPDPRDDGNIVMTGRTVRNRFGQHVPQVRYLEQGATLPGLGPEPRYVSHFATCPDADDWRRDG